MNESALGARVFRALAPTDRPDVERLFRGDPLFRDSESDVALELFDLGVGTGDGPPRDPDYRWVGCALGGRIVGCACFGPMPSTDGTFDLYWIAVAQQARGTGIGRQLLTQVEHLVARDGGRLLVIETSGASSYEGTRSFYLACGYAVLATVRDFYAAGDDRVILGSLIEQPPLALEPTVA
ncbi:MAG: GNAT family N-acetyltransferase [Gemmatimonadaceae bacterium]